MSLMHPPDGGGRARSVPILSLPTNRTRVVVFLGPLHGSRQHWSKGRTVPCLGDAKTCPAHRDPIRYYAYASALCWESATGLWDPVVVQCTSALEQQLRGRVIRGETWALTREQHRFDRGMILGKFLQMREEKDLEPEFEVLPTLQNAFGVPFVPLGDANPFPDKLILPAVAMDLENPPAEVKPSQPPPQAKSVLQQFLDHVRKQEKEGQP